MSHCAVLPMHFAASILAAASSNQDGSESLHTVARCQESARQHDEAHAAGWNLGIDSARFARWLD